MTISRILIFVLFLITFFSVSAADTRAQEKSASTTPSTFAIPAESVNPDNGFAYMRKRATEKLSLLLYSFSPPQKTNYYIELSNKRLAELSYLVEKGDMYNFEKATTRYSSTLGTLAEYIQKKHLNDQKAKAIETLSTHEPVLEKLLHKFDATTAEWRFVKQDKDYLQIYTSQLKN